LIFFTGNFFTGKLFWICLALLSATFDSCVHLLTKKALSKSGQYLVPISLCLISGLSCLSALSVIGFPTVGWDFYRLVIIVSLLAGFGMICFMAGLEKTEVSYAIPLLCFSPLLSAIWGWIFINEQVSLLGLLGVLIVMTGAYMLELHRMKDGIFEPIKAILDNKSARLILTSSVLWSITSVIDKVGVLKGSALLWSCSVSLGMGSFILVAAIVKQKVSYDNVKNSSFPVLIILGIFYALMHVSQMLAVEIGQVSYVLSLKRLGILISVIVGSLVFKEHQLKERILASTVMVFGVFLIIIFA
jgi:drug/metabolite transporter (DMT)-like permease